MTNGSPDRSGSPDRRRDVDAPGGPRPARRVVGWIRELALSVLALGGVVCLVAVAAAVFFDISLVMFKTGSMAPTIPAGSLAVVQEVPADEVRVGDVVTVDRPGELPVTHRVVTTSPGADGRTVLTLRGDANPVDDPAPYEVRTVRQVLTSVPGLAYVVSRSTDPRVLAGITVVVTILVTWSFWPREDEEDDDDVESGIPDTAIASPSASTTSACARAVPT